MSRCQVSDDNDDDDGAALAKITPLKKAKK